MNPVVHFEMPYEDRERMAEFYKKAFGWKTNMLGPEMGDYVTVATSETDEQGMNQKPGTIGGGFYKKTSDPLSQYPSIVIAVDNIKEAINKVVAAGGKVLGGQKRDGEPENIPGVGLYASFIDTEGNRAGMLQPSEKM